MTEDFEIDCNSIICILNKQYLVISSYSTDASDIYTFTHAGEYLGSCKDLPFSPIIYGADENNQVLAAEFFNGAMYLFKPFSGMEIQRVAILSDVQTPLTRSVVIDQNNDLWVLADNPGDGFKLIKFASQH